MTILRCPRPLKRALGLLSLMLAMVGSPSQAGCLDQARLTGVNLAGAEFNTKALPGIVYKNYTYPSTAELNYIAAQGANMIRLPFRWERLQQTVNGPLDPAELGRLHTTVNNASAAGLCVLLDVHNYAKYYQYKLGDPLPTPSPEGTTLTTMFIAFWLALAAEFPDANKVAFGLMNEPANIPLNSWAVIAKQTLAELRAADATNLVFVSGGRWSGLHDWFSGLEYSNASEFSDLHDPLNRAIIEVHQYTDSDYSGTHTTSTGTGCRPADQFNAKFERITEWAKTHQQTLFLGEFGVPRSSECLLTLTRFLELMDNNTWRGWSYWAAGGWWGSYPLALSGANQAPAPQWEPLKAFFFRAGEDETSPPQPPVPHPANP
ncbi:glycoside hydrolase family 5 protein [Cellvibrio sp. QJXJ]|uniref:glycoside hydrolase family 5 protein n=1 Tax=Cellvibrio sp. QJXJ TaxID=2964606 RepID=UPI0021C486C9|nr:glycoside hydrolase family 5 protein [Cellvibrio sp. QJXJ]UUA72731.1 glycoside hydrolase family 5 protein [Cellvibrio sp. QJXJ]